MFQEQPPALRSPASLDSSLKPSKPPKAAEYAEPFYNFTDDPEDFLIAALINKHMIGENILELGCGPVAPITSIFFPNAKNVTAVDINPEYLNFCKNEGNFTSKRKNALQYLASLQEEPAVDSSHPTIQYIEGDFRRDLGFENSFDAVMQIGAFGCVQTEEEFSNAVRYAHKYLKPGGTLLMVNWVEDDSQEAVFSFGGAIREDHIYRPSLEGAGFYIIELETGTHLVGQASRDHGYSALIYAVAKKRG